MRIAPFAIVLAGCVESRVPVKPLPELVVDGTPTSEAPVAEIHMFPGERMIWDVSLDGMSLGRAELVVGAADVHSEFRTASLVGALVSVHHDLTTVLDGDQVASATDVLEVDGDVTRTGYARTPGVPPVHTLHSVVGWLRAWAPQATRNGFVTVAHAGHLYRLDVARPYRDDLPSGAALRVECRASRVDPLPAGAHASPPVTLTLWLGVERAMAPVRIQANDGSNRILAELIDYHRE